MSATAPARPTYRKLAAGVAVFCLLFALAAAVFMPDDGRYFAVGVGLVNAVIMGRIATTGRASG